MATLERCTPRAVLDSYTQSLAMMAWSQGALVVRLPKILRVFMSGSILIAMFTISMIASSAEPEPPQRRPSSPAREQTSNIEVFVSSLDPGGLTQDGFDARFLAKYEGLWLEAAKKQARSDSTYSEHLDEFSATSQYVRSGELKIAMVRVSAPNTNGVVLLGLKDGQLKRVACSRESAESIPIDKGPCGDKLREVFGAAVTEAAPANTPAVPSFSPDETKIAVSSQALDGLTEEKMDLTFLGNYEKYVVERSTARAREIAEELGAANPATRINSESVYVQAGKIKLIVIRMSDGNSRTVHVAGIVGEEFRRLACARMSMVPIPIAHGPCGEKIKEVYGAGIAQ